MPSVATAMAAAQASKKAFIVFHLVGLAECESDMMPGYVWYKDADRHDGSWLTGPYVFFATGRHGDTIQSALQKGGTCRARRPMFASGGRKDKPSKLPRVKQVTLVISHWV